MNNLISTYRLQFHKDFSFREFKDLIPYFQKLGIGTIYASPILESTAGSTHGYDGVNPKNIDPEIGTLEELQTISNSLKEHRINWLQDIVPNHMAFDQRNAWLMDVMEKGTQSVFASFFDIAGNSKLFQGRLMVPFLGFPLEEVIDKGELLLAYKDNRLVIQNQESAYPLSPRSYIDVLSVSAEQDNQSLKQLLEQISEVRREEEPVMFAQKWNEVLLQLSSLAKIAPIDNILETSIKEINKDKTRLKQILNSQEYELCYWRETDEKINYRRFFTVNGLICLNVQNKDVFDQYHDLIKKLTEQGIFQGLRVDHIDGLYDPINYLEDLRQLAGGDTYVVVEKILEKDEKLPVSWPIQGTTGYEFLAQVNNLMTNKAAEETFTNFYHEMTGDYSAVSEQLAQKKTDILYKHMGGELENLYQLFGSLNLVEKDRLENIGKENIKNAIGQFLIYCPVYRYYGNQFPLADNEANNVADLLNKVKESDETLIDAVELLREVFLEKPLELNADFNNAVLEFYQRCMQFTGPLMAKGGEDTLMYNYNSFIGHNEVGDASESFGISIKDFHKKMQERQKKWPLSLNATSTHDTKRGEDVRARLNVLTDLPDEWLSKVLEWQSFYAEWSKDKTGPSENDAYLIYQTIAGAQPIHGEDEDDFANRLAEYLQKALREAKTNSTWAEPNENYEADTKEFAQKLLQKDSDFNEKFAELQQKLTEFGIVNSLVQVLLKFTCPGIPDIYRGCELWDFSLVDPDNRRPVDYKKRQEWLDELSGEDSNEELTNKLWEERTSGKIKLWLTNQLYKLRRENEILFLEGDYLPLKTKGIYKEHIFAFARQHKQSFVVTIVPLHVAILCKEQGVEILELDWKDTRIELPEGVNAKWDDILHESKQTLERVISPEQIFKKLPFAILKGSKPENKRSAGILLGINSLPSAFGIGDMGPEAYNFVDSLVRSNQKIWQLLPLNPIEEAQGNSPYSALSSMAGSPFLISPELLAEEGLLDNEELNEYIIADGTTINYEKADQIKDELLKKAYDNFKANPDKYPENKYQQFCKEHEAWLDDFALYMLLKNKHEGKPWTSWPDDFKLKKDEFLRELVEKEADKIDYLKWLQFIFDKQWEALRAYCKEKNIKLLGDIPFYVSYDSADVWSHRELFCLDEEGKITGVAGVPPDAFSADGQLWGMPVFNWEVIKNRKYDWWIERLRRNIELFDFIRLDHFRAFADYWEVPGGEKTALSGQWKLGPGEDFFYSMQNALGDLPFVAEDLGEASDIVYQLRDQFKLPGMRVLHYAFDESMPQSDYIPHNYIENCLAYTGTHDNNTTLGWYRQDADADVRSRLENYVGKEINEENICEVLIRLAYGSVAKTVIIPIQDVLNLDENSRMNVPGSGENNWTWKLLPGQFSKDAESRLKNWTELFNRAD